MDTRSKNDVIEETCAAFEAAHEALKHGFSIRRNNQRLAAMYWSQNLPQHLLELSINPVYARDGVLEWVEQEILEKQCRGNQHWHGQPPWTTIGFASVADAKNFLARYQKVMAGERDVETPPECEERPTPKRLHRTRPSPAGGGPGDAEDLLARYRRKTARLPETTVRHRMVRQRIGQSLLRRALIVLWQEKCAVTGMTAVRLLRASHIKPWKDSTDSERLNPENALLLAPQLDAAFDAGLITFEDDGQLRVSSALGPEDRALLGLADSSLSRVPSAAQQVFLAWHRQHQFKA